MLLLSRHILKAKYDKYLDNFGNQIINLLDEEKGVPSFFKLLERFEEAFSVCTKYASKYGGALGTEAIHDVGLDIFSHFMASINPTYIDRNYFSSQNHSCNCVPKFSVYNTEYSIFFREFMKDAFGAFFSTFINYVKKNKVTYKHFSFLKKLFDVEMANGEKYPWSFYEVLFIQPYLSYSNFNYLLSNAIEDDLIVLKTFANANNYPGMNESSKHFGSANCTNNATYYNCLESTCQNLRICSFRAGNMELSDMQLIYAYKYFTSYHWEDEDFGGYVETTLWLLSNYMLLAEIFPQMFCEVIQRLFYMLIESRGLLFNRFTIFGDLPRYLVSLLEVMKDYKIYQDLPFIIEEKDLDMLWESVLKSDILNGIDLNYITELLDEGFNLKEEFNSVIASSVHKLCQEGKSNILLPFLSNPVVFDMLVYLEN